jgi:diguanylate cyclase (GGDEF)-like protein
MTKEELLLSQTLEQILEQGSLTPLFQPIVSLKHNKIYGYEALIRGPSDSRLHSPINLFDAASRIGRLAELDLLCREIAINRFGQLNLPHKLFINTIPAALLHPEYQHGLTLSFLEKAGIPASQIVIELTEQYPIDDYTLMREATEHYRKMGFSIALDDLGAGYSGLRTWSELKPDFVKLDRHFMQNIHEDEQKKHFVQSMLDIAKTIKCQVVGEGIEVRAEYVTANEMGLDLVQGYYFARPTKQPVKQLDHKVFTHRVKQPNFSQILPRANTTVKNLLTNVQPIFGVDRVAKVGDYFQQHSNLIALPVLNNQNQPIGIIWKDEFMTMFASRYGRDLHGRKPIQLFMDNKPITADIDMPLRTLSQLITSRAQNQQHSAFIITENSQYRGLGNIMDLLRQITDLQIISARHANPLSGLPGNVPISENITESIKNNLNAVICYFDLDNFKPYNDIYGFSMGDKIISATAKTICAEVDLENDFVGHVGGDDFIVIFTSENWQQRCQLILESFKAQHSDFYTEEHIAAGGMDALDRKNNPTFYKLLSLSIGAVALNDFDEIKTEANLADLATKAKSAAKKIDGNSLYLLKADKKKRSGCLTK